MPIALPFRRIAVARPPNHWFHGIDRALFDIYRRVLLDLGLEIFEVPTGAFLPPDLRRISALADDLRAFGPELAIGLPHGPYALLCQLPPGKDGRRPNFFLDLLDLPTLCRWDHGPLDLAERLLEPAPATGALATLRRTLSHPRMIHWSRDTGQTALTAELGLVSPDRVIYDPSTTLPGFEPTHRMTIDSVAFIGHFYSEPSVNQVEDHLIRRWLASPGQPLWNLLEHDLDRTDFWHFASRLIRYDAQPPRRLAMLGAVNRPVTCYGDLRTHPGVPPNLVAAPGHIPFGPPLAAAFARHAITVDVQNPGFLSGYGHKPLLAFASGGFVLVDRKLDFVDAFGEAGEAVSYRDGDELAAKVDRFLTDPKARREIGGAIRDRIFTRHRAHDVFSRVLQAAHEKL